MRHITSMPRIMYLWIYSCSLLSLFIPFTLCDVIFKPDCVRSVLFRFLHVFGLGGESYTSR